METVENFQHRGFTLCDAGEQTSGTTWAGTSASDWQEKMSRHIDLLNILLKCEWNL